MKLLRNNKGETKIVAMGIGLIMLVVLGYIMFPVINGVRESITVTENSTMYFALNNYTNGVAGAITLFGVSPIVYAAAIILVILTVYLARQ